MQSFLKQPSNFFNKTKIGAKSLLSSGKKLGSTLMGTPIKVAQKLLPPTKQLAKERRENDSSQFVKNYLDFFGAKKTAKVLRNNLKITRDALVDMFETTKLLKIQIRNITDSLKMKGGKNKGGLLGGLLGGGLGMLSGLLSVASLLTNPFVLSVLGLIAAGGVIALLSNEKIRGAIFGFLEKYAKPVVGFLWNTISKLVGGLIKQIVPEWIYDPAGFVRNLITGGDEFSKKHSELDQRLKDAGMDTKGRSNDRTQQEIRTNKSGRTEEQEKIFQEVKAERSKLDETKKTMGKDMDAAEKQVVADRKTGEKKLLEEIKSLPFASKERVAKEKELRLYQAETRKLRKETREEIKSDANQSVSSQSKVEGVKESGEVKEVSESKVEGVKEGDTENVKADTSKNMEIVKNIENPIEEESDDPIIEYVPTAMSGSNNEPQVMGGSSNPPPTGGGSPSIVFFPSKNFDTISDQTAKSLMNIVDG